MAYINPEEPQWPVSQGYGKNPGGVNPPGGHTGRDKATPIGRPLYAPSDGVVKWVGTSRTMDGSDNIWLLTAGGGHCIVIDSVDGKYAFIMAHCSRTHVRVGEHVTMAQLVADSGNSGTWTTGPHVHTEVMPDRWNLRNGTYGRINPDLVFKGFRDGTFGEPTAPNQRKNGAATTMQRVEPKVDGLASGAIGSNIAREIPPHQVEVFEGYVHGQELSINGVTTDIWYKDHIGFAWAGLFTEVKTDGLPDLTPRPQLAANQRRVGPLGAKARTDPRVAENNVGRVALGGTVEVFLGYVHGESVDGNDIWYVDDRHFLWSGGFESQDVVGLPDLTVLTPPPPPAPPVEEVPFAYLSGIDVAQYQESAALNTLPADFYIIKATEGGADWTDIALASNVAEARLTGKPVAFYHFARPLVTEANTAAEEARSFLTAIKPYLRKGDRVALDWEAENQDRTDWAEEWLDIVAEATKSTPWIYLNSKAINGGDWSKVESKYPLWYAGGKRYDDTIEGFIPVPLAEAQVTWAAGVDLWQYTGLGRLPGYNGDIDFNCLYITAEQWIAGGAEGPLEEPAPNPPLEEPAPPLTDDPDDSLREFVEWLFQSFKDRDR